VGSYKLLQEDFLNTSEIEFYIDRPYRAEDVIVYR
jgi:hypothetical protein